MTIEPGNRAARPGGGRTDTLGRPMRDLRISVIDNCNFRCPYCMPAQIYGDDYEFLRRKQLLTFDEIARLARVFARFGVTKIKITGGEPLLRAWLPDLVRKLKGVEGIEEVALITNGLLLTGLARPLRRAGLDRITVSLDSLDEERFAELNGRGHRLGQILEAIDTAVAEGFSALKFNTVVQRGINDNEVLALAERFRGTPHIVRFIEYMDVGNMNGWERSRVVPSAELVRTISAVYPLVPVEPNYRGEVASRYRYADGKGEVGFISSISEPFCGDCTRVRLSADGKLYTCLFAQIGHNLRTMLRDGSPDESIEEKIGGIWARRTDRYSELRETAPKAHRVEMFHIGG